MKRFTAFISVVAISILASCELVLEVKMPHQQTRLVVNSIFSPDTTMRVALSESQDILDTLGYTRVEKAIVKVFDKNGNVIDLVFDSRYGEYISTAKPVAGQTYTIKVSANGFESVQTTARVPDLVETKEVIIDSTGVDPDPRVDDANVPITVRLNDRSDEVNYYEIRLGQKMAYEYVVNNEVRKGQYRQYYTLYHKQPGEESTNLKSLISDKFCNGKICEIKSTVDSNHIYFGPNAFNFRLVESYIEIVNMSPELYDYYTTGGLQRSAEGDPFAQPVQAYNNIENGFGIFAGYSRTRYDLH